MKTPINDGFQQSDLDADGHKITNADLSEYAGTNITWDGSTFNAAGGVGGDASMTSNEISARVEVASAAATSANLNAIGAIDAADAANAHANTVSARAVSISAELVSLMNSADAALSSRVTSVGGAVGGASMTSNEISALVQVASAAATSANAHANTVSARAVSISAELASLIASADAALSSRATSIEAHVNAVSAAGGGGTPGGTSTQVQFNDGGVFGGDAGLTYNKTNDTLMIAGDLTLSGIITGNRLVINSSNNPFGIGGATTVSVAGDLAVGYGAAASGQGTAIGYGTTAGGNCVVLGFTANASSNSVAVGYGATAGTLAFALGSGATASGLGSIAMGYGSLADAAGAFVGGANLNAIINVYFGKGIVNATPVAWTLNGTGGSGTDIAGADLILAGGRGTGTGAGGSLLFKTTDAGATGSALNSLVTRLTIGSGGATFTIPIIGSGAVPTGGATGQVLAKTTSANYDVGWVSVAAGGTTSITSAEVASISAALETHINLVSAAGVTGGASVTSNELASLVQIASLAATSADTHANTVSVRAVSISNELGSLMASADAALSTRINTASALGTTADTHANTVSLRVVSVSAELASLLGSASTALEAHAVAASAAATSAINKAVSDNASLSAVLATSIQTASAAATAADSHANTVSVRAVSISAELVSLMNSADAALSLRATSADTHANTVSARAVSISNELGSLLASTSAQLRADITSVAGLAGGGGSVTSTELSVARYIPITTQTDTDYTASIGDALTLVKMSSASAHNFTVPPNASVAFPTGTQIVVEQAGTATVTIVAGAGVTLEGGPLTTLGQYSTMVLIKQATNTWLVSNANAAMVSAEVLSMINAVSARVVSVSAELTSLLASSDVALSNRINSADTAVSTQAASQNAVISARMVSVSAELASLITSAAPRKARNTANQASITVSTASTVSGVSIIVSAGVTYTFEFQIPFTCMLPSGIVVGVVGPTTTTFNAQYQLPGATSIPGLLPALNAINPFYAQVRAIGTKVSTTSITLTGTTLVAYAWGTINPSATGSLKFVIGPNTSGGTNSGVVVLVGANILVNRISG